MASELAKKWAEHLASSYRLSSSGGPITVEIEHTNHAETIDAAIAEDRAGRSGFADGVEAAGRWLDDAAGVSSWSREADALPKYAAVIRALTPSATPDIATSVWRTDVEAAPIRCLIAYLHPNGKPLVSEMRRHTEGAWRDGVIEIGSSAVLGWQPMPEPPEVK